MKGKTLLTFHERPLRTDRVRAPFVGNKVSQNGSSWESNFLFDFATIKFKVLFEFVFKLPSSFSLLRPPFQEYRDGIYSQMLVLVVCLPSFYILEVIIIFGSL